jgi:hypothetical protein
MMYRDALHQNCEICCYLKGFIINTTFTYVGEGKDTSLLTGMYIHARVIHACMIFLTL